MDILNRSAVVLRPKQPYLEWARLDDEEGLAKDVDDATAELLDSERPGGAGRYGTNSSATTLLT